MALINLRGPPSHVKTPLETLVARTAELNNQLDSQIAEICSKAPATFTQRYITQTRSLKAKHSFDRLLSAGVVARCGRNSMGGATYWYDAVKHKEFQDGQGQSC